MAFCLNRGLPVVFKLASDFVTSADADDGGSGARVDGHELLGKPYSEPSEGCALSGPAACLAVVPGPRPVSAP